MRKYVKFLDKDRPFYKDMDILAKTTRKGEILRSVEKSIGRLK